MATGGFTGKGRAPAGAQDRLPPGQYLTQDFPVLSAGPTARVDLGTWQFTLRVGPKPVKQWDWQAFEATANILLDLDVPSQRIRTERYGG